MVTLSFHQREAIQNCDESERPYFYTFLGSVSRSQARKDPRTLHNGKGVFVMDRQDYIDKYNINETYEALLYKTIFAGAPRGDNLFSYRFTEVMSSASIPVVHADNWVLPFHHKLVDWKKCVVTIEEARAKETIAILKKISAAKRCQMRIVFTRNISLIQMLILLEWLTALRWLGQWQDHCEVNCVCSGPSWP